MRTKSFLLVFSALIMVLATIFSVPTRAEISDTKQEILQKEKVLRTINLLRATEKQRPLVLGKGDLPAPRTPGVLNAAGTITGTLFGIDDANIAAAAVVAWPSDATRDSSGTVNAYFGRVDFDGTYRIENLAAGGYYVLALADGYLPKFYDNVTNFSAATTVQVVENEVTARIDFRMEKSPSGSGSIAGSVVNVKDGSPIPRANVSLFSMDSPFFSISVTTDTNGRYLAGELPAGRYYAFCWVEGFLGEYYDDANIFEQATAIPLAANAAVTGIDFQLNRGGLIAGRVVDDLGTPLQNVYVSAQTDYRFIDPTVPPDSVIVYGYGSAYTDENGEYVITGLPASDYLVFTQVLSRWYNAFYYYENVVTLDDATPVPVREDEDVTGIDFRIPVPHDFSSLSGKVVDAQNKPLANAYIQVSGPFPGREGFQVWAYAATGEDGSYRIDDLPFGGYLVAAAASVGWQYVQRYWPDAETPEQAQPVVINDAGGQVADFNLPVVPGTATVSGRVLRDDGTPLVYAYVQLGPVELSSTSGVWAYGTTDSTGHYLINRLPAGEYIAETQYWQNYSFAQQWYEHANSRDQATIIQLTDGERRDEINFDLTLRPYYGTIAGTVSDESLGAPIERAYIEIAPLGYDYRTAPIFFWSYFAVSNSQGNFQLEYLPEGEYLVSVYAKGAFEYYEDAVVPEFATPVKVTGGQTTAVNFGLTARNDGPGVISGRVMDEWHDGFLPIAMVVARPAETVLVWPDSESFYNTVINPDGTYKITGLPEGEYYVYSFAPGYVTEYYNEVYDPAEAELVAVSGSNPAQGIDFTLQPIYWRFADPTTSARTGASIFGKITDQDGKVIHNATVYLLNDAEQPVSSAASNAEGMYELPGVPAGEYRVKATHIGFRSAYNDNAASFAEATPVTITGGRIEMNFVLQASSVTNVDDGSVLPETITLSPNYPNPFNPETRISFSLPAETTVRLRIFNLLGREVARLVDEKKSAGVHNVYWSGRNQTGELMSSGIYFYMLEADGRQIAVRKMTLLK